jgi:hypothetical protein
LSEYDPPATTVTDAPETEEAHERSPIPGNEDAMEDVDGAATVTPRGTRYNRRSGALALVTLMCCVGEAQSTATAIRHATSVNPALHGTMSIQLTAMWALAMCAVVVMVAVWVVVCKLNRNGKLVNKTTGDPYDAAPQFDSSQFEGSSLSGTRHFFPVPGNGSVMSRFDNHDCDTKNCERQQMTKNGVALQNQQWTSHHGASRRIVPDGHCRSRFDIITRMVGFINLCFGTDPDVFEQQTKLNGQSDDVAVSTVAKSTTYLTSNGDDDTDYVSEVEALCREIGRGCYAEFNLSPTRSDDLPYTNTPNEQRWTWGVGLFSTFPLKPELLLSTLRGPGVLNPRAPSGPC